MQKQPGIVTHPHTSSLLISRHLTRPSDIQFGLPAWPEVGVATQKFAGRLRTRQWLNPPFWISKSATDNYNRRAAYTSGTCTLEHWECLKGYLLQVNYRTISPYIHAWKNRIHCTQAQYSTVAQDVGIWWFNMHYRNSLRRATSPSTPNIW